MRCSDHKCCLDIAPMEDDPRRLLWYYGVMLGFKRKPKYDLPQIHIYVEDMLKVTGLRAQTEKGSKEYNDYTHTLEIMQLVLNMLNKGEI